MIDEMIAYLLIAKATVQHCLDSFMNADDSAVPIAATSKMIKFYLTLSTHVENAMISVI